MSKGCMGHNVNTCCLYSEITSAPVVLFKYFLFPYCHNSWHKVYINHPPTLQVVENQINDMITQSNTFLIIIHSIWYEFSPWCYQALHPFLYHLRNFEKIYYNGKQNHNSCIIIYYYNSALWQDFKVNRYQKIIALLIVLCSSKSEAGIVNQ